MDLLGLADHQSRIDEVLPKPFATTRLAHIVSRLIGPPHERGGKAYFAYGANMDREHMAKTAPGATLVGRAELADHRVVIAHAGYATLEPSPGDEVQGVLWFLTADDEEALDQFEGVPKGWYHKTTATLRTATGDEVSAMIYLAADPRPGLAAPGYVDQILRAAESHGLPAPYRAALDRLPRSATATWSGRP